MLVISNLQGDLYEAEGTLPSRIVVTGMIQVGRRPNLFGELSPATPEKRLPTRSRRWCCCATSERTVLHLSKQVSIERMVYSVILLVFFHVLQLSPEVTVCHSHRCHRYRCLPPRRAAFVRS